MFGQLRYETINSVLNSRFQKHGILIAAHRGSWHGNVIQNTTTAFKAAYMMGADIVETDVTSTTDHVVYALHDGVEPMLLGPKVNAAYFTSELIESYYTLNALGVPTKQKVQRLDEVFSSIQEGNLFNIDRCWKAYDDIIGLLDKFPVLLKHAIIKAPLREIRIFELFHEHDKKYMFMPICYSYKDIEQAMEFKELNIVGVEMIAHSEDDELFSDDAIEYIHDRNLYCWVNSLVITDFDPGESLYAGLDDDISIKKDPSYGWGKLMDKHIDVLQTDWPSLLRDYRHQYKDQHP